DLPQMPSESTDSRGSDSEQSRQEPDRLHVVPCDSQPRSYGAGSAENGGSECSVRRLPRERLESIPKTLPAPPPGRGHVLRGLPQSAREFPARNDADVCGE